MAEKIKPIILTDVGTGDKYTLDFNRDSVRFAESRGFAIMDVEKYPMTMYDLFFYAFRMHHRNVPREKTDKFIDEGFGGIAGMPAAMVERLVELYAQTFGSLVENDTENPRIVVDM